MRGQWYETVSKLLCARRLYSAAESCACSVTAGVRLSWDSRWRWCVVKTATNGKTGPELIPRVRVDGVVGGKYAVCQRTW